jgi:vacuolar-type H+-ATPase subunit E/Vma4
VGTKELLDKILSDARERVQAIEAETAGQVKAIEGRGQEIEAKLKAENEVRIRNRVDAILENARSRGQLEAQKIILSAKWRLITKVAEQVKQSILKSPEYGKILKLLIQKYADSNAKIHLSPADTENFGPQLKVRLGEPVPISGGLIIRSLKEDVDLSLDSILNQVLEETITQLATMLFD